MPPITVRPSLVAPSASARTDLQFYRRGGFGNLPMFGALLLVVLLLLLPTVPGSQSRPTPTPAPSTHLGPRLLASGALAPVRAGALQTHVSASRSLANNSSVVNPYAYYGVKGPAPYGIADFGVAANGSGYRYNTTSFLGTLDIGAMSASAKVVYQGHTYVFPGDTVQLNVILVLSNGTQTASYWVQNVPFFSPPNDHISLEDNVWNMSTAGTLPANTVVGNGSINSGTVYIASATNQPGNNQTLGFPANVSVKLATGTAHGIPFVRFDYLDGSGWQTYDNVTFPWAHGGWRDDGFVVDGTKYLPNNLFYDAEWVYGGPGNGLSSDNLASNFTMGLEYWNGHNYQAVPNAFNFGSDTGESMHNVSESTGLGAGAVGLPGATVTVGNSPLTKLYTRSDVSIVNVTTPLASATLTFGSLRVPFTGKEANVTLAPGSYEVRLWNGSLAVAVRNISVGAGEYLALNMTTVYYPSSVSFASSGLPQGLGWSVVIANQTFRSSGATLTVELVNGTYPYRIVPVPGYFLAQYDGTLGVVGRAVTLTVLWQVFVYPVTVEAVGLPSGVPWTVSIQGTSGGAGGGATSMNDSAVVELANGSYRYSVTIRYEYVAIVNPDTFTVLAGATSLTVQFAVRMGFLVGSVEPASARLEIAAEPVALASDGSFNTTLRPGLYSISAAAPGFTAFFTNVTVTAGNATTLTVQLKATGHSPGGGSNGTPTTPSQSPRDLLLSPVLWAGVALALVAVVGALAALSFRRRRR